MPRARESVKKFATAPVENRTPLRHIDTVQPSPQRIATAPVENRTPLRPTSKWDWTTRPTATAPVENRTPLRLPSGAAALARQPCHSAGRESDPVATGRRDGQPVARCTPQRRSRIGPRCDGDGSVHPAWWNGHSAGRESDPVATGQILKRIAKRGATAPVENRTPLRQGWVPAYSSSGHTWRRGSSPRNASKAAAVPSVRSVARKRNSSVSRSVA